jgi:hypothetical protein
MLTAAEEPMDVVKVPMAPRLDGREVGDASA